MTSNLFSIRRGILSRPGVCTPAPPPPPPLDRYEYTFVDYYPAPPNPDLYLQLTALDASAPSTLETDWDHATNAILRSFTHSADFPDTFDVCLGLEGLSGVVYIHSTLTLPPAPPTTAHYYFPIP